MVTLSKVTGKIAGASGSVLTKDYSAFTSTQIAALSTATIAALSATELATFKKAQIAALTTAQIGALGATQIALLATDQVAALTTTSLSVLDAKQAAALTAAQIGVLTGTQFSALSGPDLATFDTSEIAALSSVQIVALNTSQISSLTTDQVAALTAAQSMKLSAVQVGKLSTQQIVALSKSALSSLAQTALSGLTTGQISVLATDQIAALLTTQVANFSSAQISALNMDQIVALTTGQVAALRTNQIAALSTAQVVGLETADFAVLSSVQIASLTTNQIRALSNDEIGSLSSSQIAGLSTAQLAALSADQVNWLSTSQLQTLNSTQLTALSTSAISALSTSQIASLQTVSLAKLTAQQIAAIETSDLASLSTAQINALTSGQIGALTTDQITALSKDQIGALNSNQIPGLKNVQIAALSTAQLAAMAPTNLAKFNTQQIIALETADVSSLSGEQILALSATQIGAMTTDQIASFRAAQISTLTNAQIAGLKIPQVAILNTDQIVALTTSQTASLTAAQVATLSTTQVATMETADFAALTAAQLAAIGTDQIQALRTDEVAVLSAAKIKTLTTAQIAALTTNAIGTLSTAQISNLASTQISAFGTSQIQTISTEQLASLTAAQMAALNTAQISSLTTNQISALSSTKIAALTAPQVSALTTQSIQTLSTAQLASLKPTQLTSLTGAQIAAFKTDQISSLANTQIAAFTTGQMSALTTDQIVALTTRQTLALLASQIAALTTAQIAAMEISDFGALNTQQLSSLTTDQVRALTTVEITALAATKLSSLTTAQIGALETADIGVFSTSQIAALTTAQLSILSAAQVAQINTAAKVSALKLPQTISGAISGLAISDTLANVMAQADKLLAFSKNKQISSIQLTDAPQTPRKISTDDAKKYQALLDVITNDALAITSAKISDVTALAAFKTVKSISIEDTAANILQAKTTISDTNKTLKIAKVTVSDAVNFAQATSITDLRENDGISVAIKEIRDTAENVISHIRFDYRNLITAPGKVYVSNTTTPGLSIADAALLKGVTFIDQNFKYNIVDSADAIAAQSSKTSEKILANAGQVTVATKYSLSQLKLAVQYNSIDPTAKIIVEDNAQNIVAEGQKTGGGLLAKAALINVNDTSSNITSQLSGLETLASAKRLSAIKLSDNRLTDLRLTNDQIGQSVLTLGKIQNAFSVTPTAMNGSPVTVISPTRTITDSDSYAYIMSPNAATYSGDIMWGVGMISPDTFTLNGVNKYKVTLAPQDRLDAAPYNQGDSLDIGEAYTSYKKSAVQPFLFTRPTSTPYTTGGVLWLDLGDPANTTHSVKFENVKFTNYDYSGSTSGGYFPGKIQPTDGTQKTILSGLNIGENFRTSYSSTGFTFAWETPTDANGKIDLYLANFDTAGTQVGANIKIGQYAANADWNVGNDPDGNIEVVVNDNSSIKIMKYGIGATAVNTSHYPAMTIQLPTPFDEGGTGRVFSAYTNYNNAYNNISFAMSGTRDGQSVVDFFSYDLNSKTLVNTKTLLMSGKTPVSKMNSYRTSTTGDTIWAYQDNSYLHLTRTDKTGAFISDFVKPIPGATVFESQFGARAFSQLRNFGDGRFEVVWRQAEPGSNNTPIQYQIFDTRAQGTTLSGSATYASLLGGTPYADTLTVNYSGSVLEGGAGADQLKSNVTTSSAYLNSPTLSYAHSPAGVTVNLATGTFSGGDAEGDTMTGSFYNIIGSEFDDKLTGTSTTLPNAVYSNVFKGNGGNDILVGNGGNDLAVYNGDAINYRININPDSSVTVQDIREGSPDGTDTLTGISNLSFWDRIVTVK